MADKREALEEIVAIADAHGLTAGEVARALEGSAAASDAPAAGGSGLVGRMLAYLGATLVIAGLGVFIALNWDAMNAAARIVLTLGSGVAAFVMAVVAAGDARFHAARTPLFLIAAALQALGLLVAFDEFSTGGDWRYAVLLMTLLLALQQLLAFARFPIATLAFTSLTFGAACVSVALDLLRVPPEVNAVVVGAGLVSLALGLGRTAHRAIAPFWHFAGAAALFTGLFEILRNTAVEPVFVVAACGGTFLSVHARSRTLLVVSTVAVLGYIAWFTEQRFLDSLGWPLVLIVLGLALLGISALALRIDRRYIGSVG